MLCLDLFYWLIFLSTFQTALQTLELFLVLLSLTFYGISDKFTVYLCLVICTPHKSSHCTLLLFHILVIVVGKKMSSFSMFFSTCQKVLLSSTTQSLCEKVKGSCKCCYKSWGHWLLLLFKWLFPVHWGMSLCKNVSSRVKCSQCCGCCCDSKVNTTEGGDVQPVILKEPQGKEEWF